MDAPYQVPGNRMIFHESHKVGDIAPLSVHGRVQLVEFAGLDGDARVTTEKAQRLRDFRGCEEKKSFAKPFPMKEQKEQALHGA